MRRMANNSTRRFLLVAILPHALLCLAVAWHGAKSAAGSMNDGYGVKFTNVARAAGMTRIRPIYGDERKNKYLLETTGCGVAWFDYDNDGWLDLFFVNGTRLGGLPKGRGADQSSLPQQPRRDFHRRDRRSPGCARARVGAGRSASAITTTTASTTFSSPTTARTRSIKTTATGAFTDVSEKAGVAGKRISRDGGAARRSSITTRTATSTSSSPTTSISTSKTAPTPRPAPVCTKA